MNLYFRKLLTSNRKYELSVRQWQQSAYSAIIATVQRVIRGNGDGIILNWINIELKMVNNSKKQS